MKVLTLVLVACAFALVYGAEDASKNETTLLRGLVETALKKLKNEVNAEDNNVIERSMDVSSEVEEEIKEKDKESMIDIENGVEKHNTNIKPKEAADGKTDDIYVPSPEESDSDDLLKRQAYAFVVKGQKWTNGVVPYYFGDRASGWSSETKAKIRKGFKWWEDTTCIRFVEYSSKQAAINAGRTQYLDVGTGSGCSSGVGASNPTRMNLGNNCFGEGVVSHEAGHALGFGHIQVRSDRDQYVKINMNNVKVKSRHNYAKQDTVNVVPYDFQSTMHYGPTYFSIGPGKITIEALDNRLQFLVGSRGGLTHYDVKMMNSIYSCTKNCPANTCENTGYPGPSPACTCNCPDLTTGNKCQSLSTTGISRYDPTCNDRKPESCPGYLKDGGCKADHYNNNYIKWACPKTCKECSDEAPSQSCHGIINLGNGQRRTLSTPSGTHGKCLWMVKVNPGYTVRLEVNEFEVARDTKTAECYHWLEVRYNLLSQKGPKFCGKGWKDGHIEASLGGDVRYMVLRYDSIKASKTALRGFSGTVTSVKLKHCGSPAVANGKLTGDQHWEGNTVTIACNEGYIHKSGDLERYCKDGQWSGVAPVCIVNKCASKEDKKPRDSCQYWHGIGYCTQSGYKSFMDGNCARTCCEKALISGNLADCGQPPSVAGGSIQGSDFSEGGKVTITCTAGGSIVSGDAERTCGKDGKWTGTTPVCKSVTCSRLGLINGVVVLTGTTFRSKATISCLNGFLMTGDKERTCQADGTWSGADASCKKNRCGGRENKKQDWQCNQWVGLKYCTEGNYVSFVTDNCEKACCENALLSGNLADCGQPPSVAGGSIQGSDFSEGGKVTITCTGGGSIVSGDAERTCGKDGRWTGTTPVCKSVTCSRLSLNNGVVVITGTTFGSKATVSCLNGFLMTGDKERTCQADGTWSGADASCKKNTCGGKVNKKPVWSCNQWVGLKYCTEGNFVSYVTDNCDKACCENAVKQGTGSGSGSGNKCSGKQNTRSESSCSRWAGLDYCTKIEQFMKQNCAKTCCEKEN